MSFSSTEIEQISLPLRESLGDNIPWKYEEKLPAMLSEFAQNKADVVLDNLRKTLVHEWDVKTAKKMPKSLKKDLGDLSKITKQQKILAVPASDNTPTIVALWWPWGHGGTYSLRILLLTEGFEDTPVQISGTGIFSKIKRLFITS